ncbi:MAG: DUF2723 domain-containing protein [Chitinophagaceae bacterium]
MNFNRVNNLTGWIVCLIACLVYILTAEAGGSLWDCGEFVSSCFKLQIPHPPGAPLFVLLGRIFIVLFGDNPLSAAKGVNMMNAIASGFTILFLFWTITHFARKIVQQGKEELSGANLFAIMSAGVVGALAYTFSDSFWYSAVEGEVYALSSFFTALVFWAILKWEHAADHDEHADKWIIFIFFMMGLSIGVHLLNLLTIPAIVMVYYFKRYKPTGWGTFWAFVAGCVITGVVQVGVIQYTIKLAGKFDIWFVNGFSLPFFSGFTFFFLLLLIIIVLALKIARKKKNHFLYLGLWCFTFMLLGYSTYLTTMIRSSSNPGVDMFNVDNPNALVGYLGREQYGDFPLVKGQVFTASPVEYKETGMKYTKGENKYIEIGQDVKPVYAEEDQMFFPRVWDASNDQGHADFYRDWLNLEQGEKPTMADNIKWFVSYQNNFMYLRYFMWNFSGKQNDIQGFGNARDGNWITGIPFVDNAMLGDQSKMPDALKENKANNKLFMLPFILGLLGLFYHYSKRKEDFLVNLLLFFFTGFAIVVYLNQAGNQPRERDYAYVGSFYAFAVWIGLGVLQIREWLSRKIPVATAGYASALVCLLAVPVLMGFQEWDDHDRSKKQLARDLARNYLESCAPNAILFTFGDNDTYPLWYAQEVEGIRTDVRVINNSLLGIDWYINQLRYKVNNSNPIDVIFSADQIQGRNRDYIVYNAKQGVPQDAYFDLKDFLKNVIASDDPTYKVALQSGERINFFPVRKFKVPVDINKVRGNNTVNANDSVMAEFRFEIPAERNVLMKNDLAVLAIIAANQWDRPIYFTSPYGELGFGNYLRKDGLTYRLVPVANNTTLNTEWMMDKLLNKFSSGNADKQGVYFDEENRRHLNTIRLAYAELGGQLADMNRKEEANKILNKGDALMLESNMPYGMPSTVRGYPHNLVSMRFLEAALKAGNKELSTKVSASLRKDLEQQMRYYSALPESKQMSLMREMQFAQQLMQMQNELEKQYSAGTKPPSPEGGQVITNDSAK